MDGGRIARTEAFAAPAPAPQEVHPALVGAHSHFPTLVRAVASRRRSPLLGVAAGRLARGGRLDLGLFVDEVAVLVEVAVATAGLEDQVTVFVEGDLDPDRDLGCDFGGHWLSGYGRLVTLAAGSGQDFFPIHVFCREDGGIFVAVVEDDDSVTVSRRHSLDRPDALVATVVADIGRTLVAARH